MYYVLSLAWVLELTLPPLSLSLTLGWAHGPVPIAARDSARPNRHHGLMADHTLPTHIFRPPRRVKTLSLRVRVRVRVRVRRVRTLSPPPSVSFSAWMSVGLAVPMSQSQHDCTGFES